MIDDKKIEEAAQGAADLYEQDLPIMSYNEDTEVDGQHRFCQEFGAELFKDDAKWAINEFLKDLWHPAEEEPNHEAIRTYILGETEASESGLLPMLLRPNTNWKEFVVSHGVTNWFYADDILPKRRRREMKENKHSLKISCSIFGDTTLDGYPIVTYSNDELKILKNLLTRVLGEVDEYIKD